MAQTFQKDKIHEFTISQFNGQNVTLFQLRQDIGKMLNDELKLSDRFVLYKDLVNTPSIGLRSSQDLKYKVILLETGKVEVIQNSIITMNNARKVISYNLALTQDHVSNIYRMITQFTSSFINFILTECDGLCEPNTPKGYHRFADFTFASQILHFFFTRKLLLNDLGSTPDNVRGTFISSNLLTLRGSPASVIFPCLMRADKVYMSLQEKSFNKVEEDSELFYHRNSNTLQLSSTSFLCLRTSFSADMVGFTFSVPGARDSRFVPAVYDSLVDTVH